MKKIPEYLSYFLEDCLQWDNSFSTRKMFGGYWVYKNGKIFAIYGFDDIYMKVGENNLEDYLKYHSKIFWYEKKWKTATISYYTLPEEILEDRDKLGIWIQKSLEVPSKTKVKKKKTKESLALDKAILEALLEIPDGKVTTYQVLADKFWVHSRRIASVMKYNNFPETYPCYKVISHSRKIWWYSALDGVNTKISMLENDGIKIANEKVWKEFIYRF